MLSNLTGMLTTIITNFYISTGLVGIALAMAIESCCIPLPSEIVMPVAGALVANGTILRGTNPLVGVVLVALAGSIGCMIGSAAAYGIGYKGGRPLMLKYGRYVLISQHDADKADQFFQRWGSPTAFFSRLLPVVRTYISLPAGITKMPFGKFILYTFLGSLPWCILLAYVGSVVGPLLESPNSPLSPIFHSLDIVIVIALVLLIALYIWRHVSNDRKARAAHATAEAVEPQTPSWQQQAQPYSGNPTQYPQQPQQAQMPQQPGWNQGQQAFPQQQQPQQPQQPQWNQAQQVFPPQQAFPQQFQQSQWGQPQQAQPQQFQQPPQPQQAQPQQFQQLPQQQQFQPQPFQQPPQHQQQQVPPQPQWGQQQTPWPSQTNNDPMTPRR